MHRLLPNEPDLVVGLVGGPATVERLTVSRTKPENLARLSDPKNLLEELFSDY
jgi:hypothetical protein